MKAFSRLLPACLLALLLAAQPATAGVTTTGAGKVPAAGGGGGGSATFVNQTTAVITGATSFNFNTTGAAAGDLLIVEVMNASSAAVAMSLSSSGAMTAALQDDGSVGTKFSIFYKVIAAGDISTPTVTCNANCDSNTSVSAILYRGATTLVNVVHAAGSAGGVSVTLPAFTPGGSSKGVVIGAWVGGGSSNAVPASLAGWNARIANNYYTASGWYHSSWFDVLGGYASTPTIQTYTSTNFTMQPYAWEGDLQ